MTPADFIKKVQGFYGKYSPAQAAVVRQWLDKYEGKLPILLAEVLRSVSWQFKMPPGPKELEDAARAIKKAAASKPEQTFQPLIGEDMVGGKKAAEKLREIFLPLCRKMNIRFEERKG